MIIENFEEEVRKGRRFEFGKNWKNFLSTLNEGKIKEAEVSLQIMLDTENLTGKTFLDIGSGSGLFSLAARNLGAKVISFDFDELSVWSTSELKKQFYQNDDGWTVMLGSVLDNNFLTKLGEFDYVYSWGVLHHTGHMWKALENVVQLVKPNGILFIALYNRQQFASKYWNFVKWTYNKFSLLRPLWIFIHFLYPTLPSIILKFIQNKKISRGMTVYYDLLDWLGGYPFETTSPTEVFNFFKSKGFTLSNLVTVGGKLGCNEFVFCRQLLNNKEKSYGSLKVKSS